jgi:hypothetical protein
MDSVFRQLRQDKGVWVEQTANGKWIVAAYWVDAPTGCRQIAPGLFGPSHLTEQRYTRDQLPIGWMREYDTADDVTAFVEGEIVAGRDPYPFVEVAPVG